MNHAALKPLARPVIALDYCPHCGPQIPARAPHFTHGILQRSKHAVTCPICEARTRSCNTMLQAAKAWNTRHKVKVETSDLINRLRCRYPIGPIQPNGEPEFGWREMGGPMPVGVTLPTPIMKEAASRIEELEAQLAADKPKTD